MVFTEESSGTNAIAMSMQFKKAVYTFSRQHYCEFLKEFHFYCIPLCISMDIIGYLTVTSIEQEISKEMIAITDLLAYKLVSEFGNRLNRNEACVDSKVKLSNSQIVILKHISSGMTDKAIAIETGLSFVTVRYHKKNILKKLSSSSSIEAVIKALKLKLILLDQIHFKPDSD